MGKSTQQDCPGRSSSGAVPRSAVCSNTSPCWVDSQVVSEADQDFLKGSCAHHGYGAHTKWIGNDKSASGPVSATRPYYGLSADVAPVGSGQTVSNPKVSKSSTESSDGLTSACWPRAKLCALQVLEIHRSADDTDLFFNCQRLFCVTLPEHRYLPVCVEKPIGFRGFAGGSINCRMASNTTLNLASYFASSSSSRR